MLAIAIGAAVVVSTPFIVGLLLVDAHARRSVADGFVALVFAVVHLVARVAAACGIDPDHKGQRVRPIWRKA